MILKRRAHLSQCGIGEYVKLANASPEAWAWFICPTCKRGVSIAHNHVVLDDGTVQPSFVCMHSGCTFHVFIKLADWNAESVTS